MKHDGIFRDALHYAISQNVQITVGASFDWTVIGPEKIPVRHVTPTAVNALGAVAYHQELVKNSEDAWWNALASLLEVDSFWLHKFSMGWDRNYQVLYALREKDGTYKKDKHGELLWEKDDVSAYAIMLRREFVR